MQKKNPTHKPAVPIADFAPIKKWLKNNLFASICMALAVLMLIGISIGIYAKEANDADASKGNGIIVAIDPGHGGNDPGKVSEDGIKEKDINLAIGLKLKAKLEAAGYTVVITRESDVSLADAGASSWKRSDMMNRTGTINAAKPDCLISIHQNSFTQPQISGPQVFYHKESTEGMSLAQIIQAKLIEELNPSCKREIQSGDDYYILKKSECVGVIVECGFLSNPEETKLLLDEAYQNALTDAICNGLNSYFNLNTPDTNNQNSDTNESDTVQSGNTYEAEKEEAD